MHNSLDSVLFELLKVPLKPRVRGSGCSFSNSSFMAFSPTWQKDSLYPDQFSDGVVTFSLLFTRWMDTNEWSHPVMTSLAKASMDGVSWLHSSQISGLRHAKLFSPGPRTFFAIERLNFFLHRYSTTKALIPNTSSSQQYKKAYAITENGSPPPLGWWVEVFCGHRVPTEIDLKRHYFTSIQATTYSKQWGSIIRKLMMDKQMDIITELDTVVREHYPAKDVDRLDKVLNVIHNRDVWTPDELANEIPAITRLTQGLGGPSTENELLSYLKGR